MTHREAMTQAWTQGALWHPRFDVLAADDFETDQPRRMSRAAALTKRIVQTNAPHLTNLLGVDCDHLDGIMRTMGRGAPFPNFVVVNPANGHAHAQWALAEPITTTEHARRKPLGYAAAVTEALRRKSDGDPGYSGYMTKNPVHEHWETHWVHDRLYSLDELRDAMEDYMPPPRWLEYRRRAGTVAGLGRNCTMFDTGRVEIYRAARRLRMSDLPAADAATALKAACLRIYSQINATFTEALPASEVRATAASTYRWITQRSDLWNDDKTVVAATFSTIQAARGKKSGESRRARADARRAAILEAS